jgi:hypothetical protein
VKEIRATSGPFPTRPFYEDKDIERICEDELRLVNLLPPEPAPVRIDRFIEKRFRVIPEARDLPPGVLGYTTFTASGVKEIVIAASLELDDNTTNQRRARTTFAHEAGHGLLHAHLFATTTHQQQLTGATSTNPQVMCRNEVLDRETAYDGRWWEFQANQAMGALLLPQRLIHIAIAPFLTAEGQLGLTSLLAANREPAARHLSDIFDVNPVVARRRLDTLFPSTIQAAL